MAKKAIKVITYILVILLAVGLIGGIVYLTDGGKSNVKTFYIKHNGTAIMRDESHVTLRSGDKFEIVSNSDYTVAIYGYADYNDFDLTVGDKARKWSDYSKIDFIATGGIAINKTSDYFILTYGEFSELFGDETTEVADTSIFTFDMFKVVITSGNCSIRLTCSLFPPYAPEEIEFDKSVIEF